MYKIFTKKLGNPPGYATKFLLIMKLIVVILFTTILQTSAITYAQRISIDEKNVPLKSILKKIKIQSGYGFFYNKDLISNYDRVSLTITNGTIEQALQQCLAGRPLSFSIDNEIVVIRLSGAEKLPRIVRADTIISGTVTDAKSTQKITGATVSVKNRKAVTFTDQNGNFRIVANTGDKLIVSYIGYDRQELTVANTATRISVKLKEASQSLKDVVVTGIFERPAETYTGAASSFTAEDIAKVSNNNIITALRALDPSFQLTENINTGANPNVLPDVSIRGGNSLPDLNSTAAANLFNYNSSLNVPLFILDGFETTLQRVVDLDVTRIARVDILKDAPATAIYGSRAANGVVVIETIRPKGGKLTINYNANFTFETPDLSDYNLLNAREKLELENSIGVYHSTFNTTDQDLKYYYNHRLSEVNKGVNTDWMAIPLRNSYNQRHNLFLESGSNGVTYGIGASINNTLGVMKGSDRLNGSANSYIAYRVNKFQFKNDFTVSLNKANNSPYGSFFQYVRMNPYLTPYDAEGNLKQQLETVINSAGGIVNLSSVSSPANPLFNPSLNVVDGSQYISFTNNFSAQYQASRWLRLSSRLAVGRQNDQSDQFYPAQHTLFLNTPTFEKGSYTKGYGKNTNFEASISADVNKSFGKHLLFSTFNANIVERKFDVQSYRVQGFPNSRLDQIVLGNSYPVGSKPNGTENITRMAGLLGNVSYSYDSRYLLDFSYKLDGSSQFGTNKRFAPFWSAGFGWNVHQETFMKNIAGVNRFKLRYSYGSTGSQNFNSFLGISTSSYYTDKEYNGLVSTYLLGYGNPNLKWQITNKHNLGLDLTLFNRLDLSGNYFVEKTVGSLASISTPPSVGVLSYSENVGDLTGKGWELNASYRIISKPASRDYWSVAIRTFTVDRRVDKVSDNIKQINRRNESVRSSTPVTIYSEGQSLTAIWALKSYGIDPSTGLEVFRNADGSYTNTYDPLQKVVVGNTQADLEGSISSNLEVKGIGMNVYLRFRIGGQAYNQTLIDRVENVNVVSGNVDRRVLEERWMKPGDVTFFKGIVNAGGVSNMQTMSSSRFVQNDNLLNLESLSVYYRFSDKWNKKMHLNNTKLSFFTANMFTLSSIKRERGLNYPFSQTYSLQLQTSF
jgi:TonB-linked SusC/RagA family outer membrane protein